MSLRNVFWRIFGGAARAEEISAWEGTLANFRKYAFEGRRMSASDEVYLRRRMEKIEKKIRRMRRIDKILFGGNA